MKLVSRALSGIAVGLPMFGAAAYAETPQDLPYVDVTFVPFVSHGLCRYHSVQVLDAPPRPDKGFEGDRIVNLRQFAAPGESCEGLDRDDFVEVEDEVAGETLRRWFDGIAENLPALTATLAELGEVPACNVEGELWRHIESMLLKEERDPRPGGLLGIGFTPEVCPAAKVEAVTYYIFVNAWTFEIVDSGVAIP
jgi:hypothetical protein